MRVVEAVDDVTGQYRVVLVKQSSGSRTLASALTAALSSRSWNCISATKNLLSEEVKKAVVSSREADSRNTYGGSEVADGGDD
jgi:hypothetical protein